MATEPIHIFLPCHQDDETISMLTSILKAEEKIIIFLTHGAPPIKKSWFEKKGFRNTEEYQRERIKEASIACTLLKFHRKDIHFLDITTRKIHMNLMTIMQECLEILSSVKDRELIIHASCYEGNHKDHDSSRFVAYYLSRLLGATLVEHSINLVRKDYAKIPIKKDFTKISLSRSQWNIKKYLLDEVYTSQTITSKKYSKFEYVRMAQDNDITLLETVPKLKYERFKRNKNARKFQLKAFNTFREEFIQFVENTNSSNFSITSLGE